MRRGAEACLGERRNVERVTGDLPDGCPWWGFWDPDVKLVLRAHRFWEPGLREFWGDDPPWWLVEGVEHYHFRLERALAAFRPKPKRPGSGGGGVGVSVRG